MIDHLVYATADLAATVSELATRLGATPTPGGPHPGRGTRNHLLGLGGRRYLEIIGPDPAQPTPPHPRPFGVDTLTSPRLVTWAIAVDDIDARAAEARAAGQSVGEVEDMSRRTADGSLLAWRLAFTGDGLVPFLIDWGTARHPTEGGLPAVELVSLRATDPDPVGVRRGLDAVGARLEVVEGDRTRLVAVIEGVRGRVELG